MSYIGSPPSSQSFAPGTDTFSGTGSQTAFTLSRNVATVNDILVVVNNVDQQPSNYTVANNILTFSPAPSAGTNNIYVRYLSTNLQTITPQQGSVVISSFSATGTPSASTFLSGNNTWAVPPGTSGGGFSNMQVFTYTGSAQTFTVPAGITKVKVTVVGGGGGAGGVVVNICCASAISSGGGGGGAAIEIISGLTPGGTVSVTVGAGGTAGSSGGGNGGAGGTSSFGAYCSATGGAASLGRINSPDPLSYNGGLGSGGDLNIRGGCGTGSLFTGGDVYSGNGGASIVGGGISGATTIASAYAGAAGGQYGGGGGGAKTSSGFGGAAGGAGAAGVVVVEY